MLELLRRRGLILLLLLELLKLHLLELWLLRRRLLVRLLLLLLRGWWRLLIRLLLLLLRGRWRLLIRLLLLRGVVGVAGRRRLLVGVLCARVAPLACWLLGLGWGRRRWGAAWRRRRRGGRGGSSWRWCWREAAGTRVQRHAAVHWGRDWSRSGGEGG